MLGHAVVQVSGEFHRTQVSSPLYLLTIGEWCSKLAHMLEDKKRNQKIYKDRTDKKMTWRALMLKYDLSAERLRQIVTREHYRLLEEELKRTILS